MLHDLFYRAITLQNHGIVYLPEFIADNYYKKGLIQKCMESYTSEAVYLYITWPNRQLLPKKVKVFIDFLSKKFAVPTV